MLKTVELFSKFSSIFKSPSLFIKLIELKYSPIIWEVLVATGAVPPALISS